MTNHDEQLAAAIHEARKNWKGGGDEDFDAYIAKAAADHLEARSKTFTPPSHLDWIPAALEEVAELMRERGAKYGPGNIAQFGDYGVLVRLSDKLSRMQHSLEHDHKDESVEDTWKDIIGYGLIGLAWSRGDWPGSFKDPRSQQVSFDSDEFPADE